MLCNDTLKVEGTFNLYSWEPKVILQLLSNKPVLTWPSIEGHAKAPVGVDIFWDLLVWLLKGHLALEAKARGQPGNHTQLCSIYLCKLIGTATNTKGERRSLITALAKTCHCACTASWIACCILCLTLTHKHTQFKGHLRLWRKMFWQQVAYTWK